MLLRYINLLVHILVACKYVALFNALETCISKGSRDNNTVEYSIAEYYPNFYIIFIPGILLYSKKEVCRTGQSPFPAHKKP